MSRAERRRAVARLPNTNASPGWHTNAGILEMPADSAPFVTLAAGQTGTFAFWFMPEGVWIGVFVFAAAIAVSMAVWRLRISPVFRPGTENRT